MLQLPFPRPGILFAVILSDGRNPGNISDSRYSAPCGGNYWDSGPSTWISLSKKKNCDVFHGDNGANSSVNSILWSPFVMSWYVLGLQTDRETWHQSQTSLSEAQQTRFGVKARRGFEFRRALNSNGSPKNGYLVRVLVRWMADGLNFRVKRSKVTT